MRGSMSLKVWPGRAVLCVALGLAVCGAAFAGAPDAARLEEGRALFRKNAVPACAVCHTLQDAQATGARRAESR